MTYATVLVAHVQVCYRHATHITVTPLLVHHYYCTDYH